MPLFIAEDRIVLNGQEFQGWEELLTELSLVPGKKELILQVAATSDVQYSPDWPRIKHLLATSGREYGYKGIFFVDQKFQSPTNF